MPKDVPGTELNQPRRMLLPALVASATGYLTFVTLADTTPLLSVGTFSVPPFELIDLAGALLVGATCAVGARAFAKLMRIAKGFSLRALPLRLLVSGASLAGLFVLYRFAPDYPVRWSDAMSGAVTAGIVLELLKRGFGLYVTTFPTYQTIYGALATIPIFLIWMYVMWNIVLWGAEMAASLPEWRSGARRSENAQRTPSEIMAAAASVLALLLAAQRGGGGLRWRHLQRRSGQPMDVLTAATEALRQAHYIEKSDRNAWFLARDLGEVTLADLHEDLGLSMSDAAGQAADATWGAKLAEALRGADQAGHAAMDISLKPLLATDDSKIAHLVADRGPGDDEDEDGEPRDYKNRLLALLGLAWLVGR